MPKPLGERIFDAVFSGFNRIDWYLDGWSGGWGVERLEQGFLVGVKGDGIADIIWAGYVDGGEMKCQLRGESHLEFPLEKTELGDERKIMIIKSCWPKLLENRNRVDRAKVREAVGKKILNLCKSFGSVELDLGLRGDIFFKARSLEELMLKVDLLGDDTCDEEDKED